MLKLLRQSNSKRVVKITFRLSLFSAMFGFVGFGFGKYLGLEILAYFHLCSGFIYILSAILALCGKLKAARIIFFIFLNLGIIITASYIGRAGHVEYLFLYCLALPFTMFSFKKEKKYVYFFSCLSGLLWIILNATDFNFITKTKLDQELAANIVYPLACISTFFFVISQLIYFSKSNLKYYSKIYSTREFALEASEAKSKFLSTMSHEIRTPLNAVIGLSHILGDNKPREDQKENIEALNYSGKILLSLLNNVLDFSKMQSTKIKLDNIPTDIAFAIKQIKKNHEATCQSKGIDLFIIIDKNIPTVLLDIVRFNQVINNLLSNAIKFTDQGKVTLIIKKKKLLPNNQVLIHTEVRDTGIGIPQSMQGTIWEAFAQASNTTNKIYGGTGLGLPIVQSIVKAMGSKVKILSKVGKGSRFYFDLKLAIVNDAKLEKSKAKKNYNFSGKKVLLVDDNLINVMVAKQILEKANLQVSQANDGLTAVNMIKDNAFDIVLMDIQMPIMDGYTATQEIRKFNTNVPILALSATVFTEIKDKINECGMNGFVFKPITPEDLLQEIEKFTNHV
ncbi:response regulator [Polaribacter sp. R77954]|uniref:response regulator n=1 Tax=Polaribacter sp. R77954 TaxID=3093870 RepID=UPI0037CAA3FD